MGKDESTQKPAPPASKRKRQSRRSSPPTPRQQAWKVLQQLRALVESRQERIGHHSGPSQGPEDLEIRIRLPLEKRVGKDRYDTLTDELLQALDSSHKRKRQTRQSPFDPELGTIHCFQCTQRCDHRSPPGNNAVFAGYTATGKPVWSSLTNALLNSGDPRVDRLHGRGRLVLAHRWSGAQRVVCGHEAR